HTGPQLHRCIRGRTDGSIRLRAKSLQLPLASSGASTDVVLLQRFLAISNVNIMRIALKPMLRQTPALIVGVIVATTAVSVYTYVSGWQAARAAHVNSEGLLVPLSAQVRLAADFSFVYALIIEALCIPCWLLLAKRGQANRWTALTLGFVATMAAW